MRPPACKPVSRSLDSLDAAGQEALEAGRLAALASFNEAGAGRWSATPRFNSSRRLPSPELLVASLASVGRSLSMDDEDDPPGKGHAAAPLREMRASRLAARSRSLRTRTSGPRSRSPRSCIRRPGARSRSAGAESSADRLPCGTNASATTVRALLLREKGAVMARCSLSRPERASHAQGRRARLQARAGAGPQWRYRLHATGRHAATGLRVRASQVGT
jgi:hypothetical protein